jgi:tetratricopeptide (TPR) repeat protein
MNDIEKAEKLMNQGFNCLDEYEYDKAIKIGKKLKKLYHSSAFEILALAYKEKDESKQSIKILEEGVSLAPKVWRLWQLLGNYYSDDKRYSDSQKCFDTALSCPNVDESSVYYNSSVACFREGKFNEALKQHDKINYKEPDHVFNLRSQSQKIDILIKLNKYEEAVKLGQKLIKKKWGEENEEIIQELSYTYASLSEGLWKLKKEEEALNSAWKAIELNKHNDKAAWMIREIEGKISDNAKHFNTMIEGIWPTPFEGETDRPGFFTTYDVIADTEEEAVSLIKRFEPKEVRDTIKVEEIKIIEERSNDPIGVYETSGYGFFPRGDNV